MFQVWIIIQRYSTASHAIFHENILRVIREVIVQEVIVARGRGGGGCNAHGPHSLHDARWGRPLDGTQARLGHHLLLLLVVVVTGLLMMMLSRADSWFDAAAREFPDLCWPPQQMRWTLWKPCQQNWTCHFICIFTIIVNWISIGGLGLSFSSPWGVGGELQFTQNGKWQNKVEQGETRVRRTLKRYNDDDDGGGTSRWGRGACLGVVLFVGHHLCGTGDTIGHVEEARHFCNVPYLFFRELAFLP